MKRLLSVCVCIVCVCVRACVCVCVCDIFAQTNVVCDCEQMWLEVGNMLDIRNYPYEALRHSLVYEAISWLRLLNMCTIGSSSSLLFFAVFFFGTCVRVRR